MSSKISAFAPKAIEYLFYALFFFVPLVFAGNTSELFEFNKMWITFAITILIFFFWSWEVISERSLKIQRTPLDIPILLFVVSQMVSTVISLDVHTSIWGYYSRFNGGLLSTFTYVFLFYAFVSHFSASLQTVKRILYITIAGAIIAAFWAFPSHFGYDPTCLVFRGNFDVSCWTVDFQPKVRIFGTLGQPAWLAAYLAALIPVTLGFAIKFMKNTFKESLVSIGLLALSAFFYVDFLWTQTRAGVLGLGLGLLFMFAALILANKPTKNNFVRDLIAKNKVVVATILIFAVLGFFAGIPLSPLDKLSFGNLKASLHKTVPVKTAPASQPHSGQLGGTDSAKIRLIVWKGALNIWKSHPLFGTGVETYAFAYYKQRPPEHNLTSEWNFLYNKAHNEYLNYLATTGAFGLLTYLSFIGLFLAIAFYLLLNRKNKIFPNFSSRLGFSEDKETLLAVRDPVVLGLIAGFLTILVTNFFGFSVVIMNIFLFLFPAIVLIYIRGLKDKTLGFSFGKSSEMNLFQWSAVVAVGGVCLYLLYTLFVFWKGDTQYALGYNYNRAGAYQQAYPLLHQAVATRPEPVFRDEMSVNDAVMAVVIASSGQAASQSASTIQALAGEATTTSDQLVAEHPNNIIFWKSRVRILYTLSQLNPSYLPLALEAMKKTYELGGNEASIAYNLGVLYGQNNDPKNAVKILERTIALKPDYREAHFALGIFYNELAVDSKGNVIHPEFRQKAIDQMDYILKNINPKDPDALNYLKTWTKQ